MKRENNFVHQFESGHFVKGNEVGRVDFVLRVPSGTDTYKECDTSEAFKELHTMAEGHFQGIVIALMISLVSAAVGEEAPKFAWRCQA